MNIRKSVAAGQVLVWALALAIFISLVKSANAGTDCKKLDSGNQKIETTKDEAQATPGPDQDQPWNITLFLVI